MPDRKMSPGDALDELLKLAGRSDELGLDGNAVLALATAAALLEKDAKGLLLKAAMPVGTRIWWLPMDGGHPKVGQYTWNDAVHDGGSPAGYYATCQEALDAQAAIKEGGRA